MIDTGIIKQHYKSLNDEQLISLVKNEGHQITAEAFELIRNEFFERNLDFAPLESVEEIKLTQTERNFNNLQQSVSLEFEDTIWDYVLQEKKNGVINADILAGLKSKGISEDNANLIISSLYGKAKKNYESYKSEMQTGGIVCAVGLTITFVTFSAASNGGSYWIAWGAIIFGAIRFFKGMAGKDKYEAIMANIEVEA